jgi:hypothetical protein
MCSDADAIQFLERRPDRSLRDREAAFPASNSDLEMDAGRSRLEQALIRKMPAIRRRVEAASQSEWSLHEYLERLYNRLRKRLALVDDLDRAIDSGIQSLLHEDARNRDRRSVRVQPLDDRVANQTPHPSSLQFVTALVCQDKLRRFIELLDPWTRAAFYAVHIDGDEGPRANLARRFGMKERSFNKRLQREIDKAKEKYITIYGQG